MAGDSLVHDPTFLYSLGSSSMDLQVSKLGKKIFLSVYLKICLDFLASVLGK